jgi:hypothetical protein
MLIRIPLLVSLLALSACATMPVGPSVLVLPGSGKSFEQFQEDNAVCQDWAAQQAGADPQQAGENRAAAGAAIGTLAGAAAGAAIGAAVGDPGAGAAIGAGSGLILGTASGVDAGRGWYYEVQRRYDNAFQQCMYAKGNQIPMSVAPNTSLAPPPLGYPNPPRTGDPIPPPPPGPPPPPPS